MDGMFEMDPAKQADMIEENLDNPDVLLPVLEGLCTTLVMQFEEYIQSIDVCGVGNLLIQIMEKYGSSGDIITMAARALALILEHVPNSAAQIAQQSLAAFNTALKATCFSSNTLYVTCTAPLLAEEVLRGLKFLAVDDHDGKVLASAVLTTVCESLGKCDLRGQRQCFELLGVLFPKLHIARKQLSGPTAKKKLPGGGALMSTPEGIQKELRDTVLPAIRTFLESFSNTVAALPEQWPTVEALAEASSLLSHALRVAKKHDLCNELVTTASLSSLVKLAHFAAGAPKRHDLMHFTVAEFAAASPRTALAVFVDGESAGILCQALAPSETADENIKRLKDPFAAAKDAGKVPAGLHAGAILAALGCVTPSVAQSEWSIRPVYFAEHKWEWEDDMHTFSDYPDEVSTVLDAAYRSGLPEQSIDVRGNKYDVNFEVLKQINPKSGVSRNVRRAPYAHKMQYTEEPSGTKGVGTFRLAKSEQPALGAQLCQAFMFTVSQVAANQNSGMLRTWGCETLVRLLLAAHPMKPTTALHDAFKSAKANICQLLADRVGERSGALGGCTLLLADVLVAVAPSVWCVPQELCRFGVDTALQKIPTDDVVSKRAAAVLVHIRKAPAAEATQLTRAAAGFRDALGSSDARVDESLSELVEVMAAAPFTSFELSGSGAPAHLLQYLDGPGLSHEAKQQRAQTLFALFGRKPAALRNLVEGLTGTLYYFRSLPTVETAHSDPTGPELRCRTDQQLNDACAAVGPLTLHECVDPKKPVKKEKKIDRKDCCPNGHRLKAHKSTTWSCDLCEQRGEESMACRACDFDICPACHSSADVGYKGGEPQDTKPDGIKVHLLATVGDLEVALRKGSTGGSASSLGGRLAELAARLHQRMGDSDLGGLLQAHLLSLQQRGESPPPEMESGQESGEGTARYQLAFDNTPEPRLHETMLSVLYHKAMRHGQHDVLDALDQLLVVEESSAKGKAGRIDKKHMSAMLAKAGVDKVHVPRTANGGACNCGKASRDVPPMPRLREAAVGPGTESLRLLAELWRMNATQFPIVEADVFVSQDLSSHVLRVVGLNALRLAVLPYDLALPAWLVQLSTRFPFLLSKDCRCRVALFATCGAAKALSQAVQGRSISLFNGVGPSNLFNPRPIKTTVARPSVFVSALTLLPKHAEHTTPISIEFEGEVGTGSGPAAQFYTLLAEEFQKQDVRLWRQVAAAPSAGGTGTDYVNVPKEGLYFLPTPQTAPADLGRQCSYAYLLGCALARSLRDGKVCPLPLSNVIPFVVCHADAKALATADLVRDVDATLGSSLQYLRSLQRQLPEGIDAVSAELDALTLSFVLPGDDTYELKPGGATTAVTPANLGEYIQLVQDAFLFDSVAHQNAALQRGFRDAVFPDALRILSPTEVNEIMCGIACGDEPLWTADELWSVVVGDHGYTQDSAELRMLVDVLVEISPQQQREFLEFCTGCPRLPVGGIREVGKITVVRKDPGSGGRVSGGTPTLGPADASLPSCNTCFRYLKLPAYRSKDVMKEKLIQAVTMSSGFHLS